MNEINPIIPTATVGNGGSNSLRVCASTYTGTSPTIRQDATSSQRDWPQLPSHVDRRFRM